MGKHSKEKNLNIYKILIIIFLAVMIYSGLEIVKWFLNNMDNKKIQAEISKAIIIDDTAENEEEKFKIDFKALKEKNEETVGWIKVNGTDVEYVVVKGANNNYYLTHNFGKEYNRAGWIFADYKNKFDGTDKNIIIYGHNRKDNSMFGSLTKILKEEWYNNEENYKITFITEEGISTYEVFSVYKIEDEDYYIQTDFSGEVSFKEFIKTIKNRSIKNFNIEVGEEDSILTLSTCANNDKYRVVLHAKKTEFIEKNP